MRKETNEEVADGKQRKTVHQHVQNNKDAAIFWACTEEQQNQVNTGKGNPTVNDAWNKTKSATKKTWCR